MNTKSLWELKTLVVIAILYVITIAQPVLFPLLMAFFLYLLVNPILEWLVRIKVPKVLASALISSLFLAIIFSGIASLTQPAIHWIQNAPENLRIIEKKFRFVKVSLGKINKAAETAQDVTDTNKESVKVATPSTNLAPSLFGFTSNIFVSISTILLLLFFLLIYFKPFLQNLEKVLLYRRRKSTRENPYIVSLKNEVSRYLFTFSIICVGLGTVMAFVFWLLELPNALLWGVMVMMLTFIPYIGHLIGIIIILFVSLITFDSYFRILAPPIIYFLFTVLEGQIITPIFLGSRLNLNPLIIFLNIFIWGWLWGVSGALISVPLLVTIKITLEYIPTLSKYALLLEK